MLRFLFGPVDADFAQYQLSSFRRDGQCLIFGDQPGVDIHVDGGDSWQTIANRLPDGFRPDAICLWLAYTTIPASMWEAPIPLIGLAADWNLLWHYYRGLAPACSELITDSRGATLLARAGHPTRSANLFGLSSAWQSGSPTLHRDIDVCFIGNLNSDVHAMRSRWLLRLARHSHRRKVLIRTGIFGDEYRQILRRSRIVLNHSIRGECNLRTIEAPAAGALLFSEAGNHEVDAILKPGQDYVAYTDQDFDALLNYFLDNEPERTSIAEAGERKVQSLTFERLWQRVWTEIEHDWETIASRPRETLTATTKALLAATQAHFQKNTDAILAATQAVATALIDDSSSSALRQALTVLSNDDPVTSLATAKSCWESNRAPYTTGVAYVQRLASSGQSTQAIEQGNIALSEVSRTAGPLDVGHSEFVRPDYGRSHVNWERCGWGSAGDLQGEHQAKMRWSRWHLHAILAELTGDLSHYYEAALASDHPATRAALGCALARAGRKSDALVHLRDAVDRQPFDIAASRALFQLYAESGDSIAKCQLARDLRALANAAPQLVQREDWFAKCPPAGDELVSIIIPVLNHRDLTAACVKSLFEHSRAPCELIMVDNGSTDASIDDLRQLRPRGPVERVEIITNANNRGFPVACNQGLMRATGEYIVFLNNDTVVTPGWLEGLVNWIVQDWPHVGLVGPITNYAPTPQGIRVPYSDLSGLNKFAKACHQQNAGKALQVERISGFCLMARRDVLKAVGGFDERFGLGFFDDDDLGMRVRDAGYKLVVALDTYVHHHGSQTFRSLGINTQQLLEENFGVFRDKWGVERTQDYRSPSKSHEYQLRRPPTATPIAVAPAPAHLSAAPKISLCMIVRNEEHHLPACLDSVQDMVNELVIVDTGSTDRTREIAKERGAIILDFPWIDDFAAARNHSIESATGDYILWMDADDRLEAADRDQLNDLFRKLDGSNTAYVMKCVCIGGVHSVSSTVVDHVRLFRRLPAHRFRYRVHEQILPALRSSGAEVQFTEIRINHVGYCDPALRAKKLERDLRILRQENAEHPDDPFTLFNLGSVYQELDKSEDALPLLQRSLQRSDPADSIVRKLYALIVSCYRRMNMPDRALAECRAGRAYYPQDAELLFQEGTLCRECGDPAGAEKCWRQLLETQEGNHFASVDSGLRGPKARHNLAALLMEQKRYSEAEAQWRTALTIDNGFVPGWLGLGELYLRRKRWDELDQVVAKLGGEGPNPANLDAGLLRARAALLRQEFAATRWITSELIVTHPEAIEPRVILSHALLQEGKDWTAAEEALNDILRLDPNHREARHNLQALSEQRAAANRM